MTTENNSINRQVADLLPDDQRLDDIRRWIEEDLQIHNYQLEVASADASFRRYFRLLTDNKSLIIMDAPPEKEDCESFVKVAKLIEASGVQAPHIFNFSEPEGFMLLSDLGSTAFLDKLNDQTADSLYADAISAISKMQEIKADLPAYNAELLQFEMSLFKDWYLEKHLGFNLNEAQLNVLSNTFDLLTESALEQSAVFVHRDYHSRNLMITEQSNPGVIDFQDAVNGPASYDLVSLIKDCYIAWPRSKQLAWIDLYLQQTPLVLDKPAFIKHLDFMGMQRHLKATGIFARLNHRDGKPGYLKDIPRTMTYVIDVCQRYSELTDFSEMLLSLNVTADVEIMERIQ